MHCLPLFSQNVSLPIKYGYRQFLVSFASCWPVGSTKSAYRSEYIYQILLAVFIWRKWCIGFGRWRWHFEVTFELLHRKKVHEDRGPCTGLRCVQNKNYGGGSSHHVIFLTGEQSVVHPDSAPESSTPAALISVRYALNKSSAVTWRRRIHHRSPASLVTAITIFRRRRRRGDNR
jgi:hypothetical protein